MSGARKEDESTGAAVDDAANSILTARRTARVLDAAAYSGLRDLQAGRMVADRLGQVLADQGVAVAGVKLGAHDRQTQLTLGIPGPVVALLYQDWMFPNGACLSVSDFIRPKLECEIGFILRGSSWKPVACVEIADSRFDWLGQGGQIFADFALNGAIITGTQLARVDSSDEISFDLWHNDSLALSGSASPVAAWLLASPTLSDRRASFIASGALHPLIDLRPGNWKLRFGCGAEVMMTIASAIAPPRVEPVGLGVISGR
jgi:hypothetical protein